MALGGDVKHACGAWQEVEIWYVAGLWYRRGRDEAEAQMWHVEEVWHRRGRDVGQMWHVAKK
eukprot:1145954-Pelagomonas_calceolata.AAC.2